MYFWFFEDRDRIIFFSILLIIAAIVLYQILFALYYFLKIKFYTFSDRHILITGGSKGIGLILSKLIYAEGGKITIIDNEHILELSKNEILDYISSLELSPHINFIPADLLDEISTNEAIEASILEYGPIDTLIACNGEIEEK